MKALFIRDLVHSLGWPAGLIFVLVLIAVSLVGHRLLFGSWR